MTPTSLRLDDGRSVDLFVAGPAGGVPVVYHHGTPGAGLPLPDLLRELERRGLRYVGWSRPGFGGSTRQPGRTVASIASDAAQVLDKVSAPSAWMLGWSGGGPHALACAALLPGRVLGTAIVGSVAPYPAEGLDWFEGIGAENVAEFRAALDGPEALLPFKEAAWPVFRDVAADQVAAALGDLVDEVDRGSITDVFADFCAHVFREGLRESYWGWFDEDMMFAQPWGFDLGDIDGPVHVWQGAHDRMVPFGHGQWLANHVGGACPHLLDDAGHLTLVVDSLAQVIDELVSPGS